MHGMTRAVATCTDLQLGCESSACLIPNIYPILVYSEAEHAPTVRGHGQACYTLSKPLGT